MLKNQNTQTKPEGRPRSNLALVVTSSMTGGNQFTGGLILENNDSAVWERLISFIVIPIQMQLPPGEEDDKPLISELTCKYCCCFKF